MADTRDEKKKVRLRLRSFSVELLLPVETEVIETREPGAVADVSGAVREALAAPIGCMSFEDLCRGVLARSAADSGKQPLSVVVVVSDQTRPVPYRGEGGILWPLLDSLLDAGFPPEWITILVATGTHRVLSEEEIWDLFDQRVRRAGVHVRCHDAADASQLRPIGRTAGGIEVSASRTYVEADFRILTGLVEPHYMAGASGGRKSICPGLLNVQSVRDLHGPAVLADGRAANLVLAGNPCHELSLEIARMVPPDFIMNVTIRQDGRVAGVFAGDMEEAHEAAVNHVRSFAQVSLNRVYDVVVTHGGHVGVNHYQASKAALSAAAAVRKGGYLVVVADTTEPDPLGTDSYRNVLGVLAGVGPEAFNELIQGDHWQFAHDQWGVQMWAKLLEKVPAEHLFYFSPQTSLPDYAVLPCADLGSVSSSFLGSELEDVVGRFVTAAVTRACEESEAELGHKPAIAYLAAGPHCVPVVPSP